jgi:hypothetical protein
MRATPQAHAEIFGVKWRNWKMMFKDLEDGYGSVQQWSVPRFYNLYLDPTEQHVLGYQYKDTWVRWPIGKVLVAHMASLKTYPSVPPGAPDPYVPAQQQQTVPGLERRYPGPD